MPLPDLISIRTCSAKTFRDLVRRSDPRDHPALFRERARHDVVFFARQAMRGTFRLPFAPFHHELFRWHALMAAGQPPEREGRRFALAAPRGHAKSTIVSFLLPLHDIAYATEHYILLISATQRQAQQRLRTLRAELTGRTALNAWFSPLFTRERVESTARVLTANGVRVEALGAGAEMRGITHDSWRPTKIILDDAESSAGAESARRRERLAEWFREVVENLGARYTHLLAIGTILHPAGLLASLLERPDFESLKCRSIIRHASPSPRWEEWKRLFTNMADPDRRETARRYFLEHRAEMESGADVLWPRHEDFEQLQVQLLTQGRRAFYQEKQNEPLGPEEALFEPDGTWRARKNGDGVAVFPPSSQPGRPPLRA